ncbi:hypothetical protein [Klebsiella pneumoniae]|uniref:hypothetical protein n=1 Tax=Klebsiella pneumoniae TaxID=573 RepID=UPI002FEEF3D8|nr:hypothetical protein [Klebsiella quasipneumoniae subsp. similipneumoniae]
MAVDLITPVKSHNKLYVASTSQNVAVLIDIPESIDANAYFVYLSTKIASDLETLSNSVKAVKQATLSSIHEDFSSIGIEMSERIAKLEKSLSHLEALVTSMDAKLDRIIEQNSEEKAVSAVLKDKFVEYDKKLDKKPSKDEVEKLISQGTTKQILWTVATLLAIAAFLYKIFK